MYIVLIAWLYVTVLMAATEPNLTAVALTFMFYGLMPVAIFLWLFGTPQRRRDRAKAESLLAQQQAALQQGLIKDPSPLLGNQEFSQPDRTDTKQD